MELFDNITKTVKDDLKITLAKGSRLSIAAACFSIYAYSQLKKQLDSIEKIASIIDGRFEGSSLVNQEYRYKFNLDPCVE